MNTRRWIAAAAVVMVCAVTGTASAASAKDMYAGALAREQALRAASSRGADPTLKQMREVIAAYEAIVKRYPSSGYADNALYQAAMLAVDAYHRLVDERDRRTAVRLLKDLVARYPTSKLVAKAREQLSTFAKAAADRSAVAPTPASPPVPPPDSPKPAQGTRAGEGGKLASTNAASEGGPDAATPRAITAPVIAIKDIKRITLPEVVRVLIELDGEVAFREERLDNPARMFVDLKGTRVMPPLLDAVLNYTDDAVKQIRLGRHPQSTTRVVLDLSDVARYSVFTLYNPYRIVIDCERRPGVTPRAPLATPEPQPAAPAQVETTGIPTPEQPAPIPSVIKGPKTPAAAPATNLQGGFSLARQLGLGVSRIVIDPGHGGHDTGARGMAGLRESALVLDIAVRLEKLLLKEPGVDVVLTRRTDEFIPLEERTAIANREHADLFLSIHANASRNTRARGVETYFLNFASNPEAEAVAARENMTTGQTMHKLPDIVKAIALNTKLDESRDFATLVQRSMVQRLRAPNKTLRDLGVKQAPFVVLIGAAMPSVLAEISFVTNRQEAALLKNGTYRQRIADALFNAIVRYQRSLKNARTIAKREAQER